jgi:hypothetical protein
MTSEGARRKMPEILEITGTGGGRVVIVMPDDPSEKPKQPKRPYRKAAATGREQAERLICFVMAIKLSQAASLPADWIAPPTDNPYRDQTISARPMFARHDPDRANNQRSMPLAVQLRFWS